jgi:hypothetical protein
MSARSDRIGQAIADALNSPPLDVNGGTLEQRKVRIWQAIAAALDPQYEPTWIHILVDPTYGAGISTDPATGLPVGPETMAYQENPVGLLPVAIWIKNGTAATAWSRVWPASTTIINTLPPAVVASTLYPAKVNDPLYRPECKCHMAFASGVGWNSDQWTSIGGVSTWQHNNLGAISGWVFGGFLSTLFAQDRVYIAFDGALGMGGLGGPSPYLGIYEVLDPGSSTTYAVIRRTTDANAPATLRHGMVVKVVSGIGGTPDYPAIATADPIVVDSTALTLTSSLGWTTPYSPTEAYELLTGPQLTSEGASAGTLTMTAIGVVGTDLSCPFPQVFETLAGTPGVDTYPAEITTFDVESVTISGLTGTAVMQAAVYVVGASQIVLGESTPVGNGTTNNLSFQAIPSAPVSLSPTAHIGVEYFLKYTSTTEVTVTITYSSAAHLTRITVPLQMPISGASDGDHQHLTRRDQDVASSDPTKAAPCHPACALGDGLLQIGVQSVTTSGGCIPVPNRNTVLVTVAGDSSGIVQFIGTTGLKSGTHLWLVFLNPCAIEPYDSMTTPPAGFAQFLLDTDPSGNQNTIDWLTTPISGGRIGVIYFATGLPQSPCFLMTEGPVV